MKNKYSKVTKIWAGMGYQSKDLKNNISDQYGIDLEIIQKATII